MPRELLRQRSTRVALVLLALLYGSAIFAPLLASDLPITMVAADERAFSRALRTLPAVASEFAESPGEETAAAVRLRLERLARGLPVLPAERLSALRSEFEPLARASRGLGSAEARRAFAEHTREVRDELCLASADAPGVELAAVRSFPLPAALAPLDWLAMGLFLAAVGAPLWWRRHRRLGLALGLGLPLLLAGASWRFGTSGTAGSPKAEMASGGVRVESAVFPPIPFGFAETHLEESLLPPSFTGAKPAGAKPAGGGEVRPGEPPLGSLRRHWLGTDGLGRDVLARLLHGGRLSLTVALLAAALVTLVGMLLGALAGTAGGLADHLFLRLVEVVQSFPAFLLILAGVAFVPRNVVHPSITISLVIGVVGWTEIGRLVRAELLRLRELDVATSARALGIPPVRIAFRHLLPLALPPVFVAAAFATSGAVLTESAISFLGFGIGPPAPSWGGLIAVERDAGAWWLQLFPGACIFLTVVAFNLLGEGLRRALDPRERPSEPASAALEEAA